METVEWMSVDEWFNEMQRQYIEATPWPWPRTMTENELDIYRTGWPELKLTHGAIVGGNARVHGQYQGVVRVVEISWDSAMSA